MRTKGPALVIACLFLALFWAMPVMAQEQTGSIEGVVRDSSGGVLPGVTVEARSPQVVGVNTAVTDAQGVFRFPALPPGTYEITASLSGFQTKKVTGTLALGQLLKVPIDLSVAGVSETVQVTGEAPLIDTKQNASFATIERTTMEKIPKGRDFTSVVTTAPGAQDEAYAGGIQIDGASGSENRFVVDGMDTTAMRSGTSNKTVLVDFVQEVQVKSSGYNAEFGGSTGGVISAISKAGSNSLHASGGMYYTGNPGRGELRQTWRINPFTDTGGIDGQLEQVTGRDNDKWNNFNPLVDIGGPVIKDRLWYYAGFAQNRNDYTRTVKFMNSNPVGVQQTFDWWDQQRYLNWNVATQLSNNIRVKISGANQWNSTRKTAPGMISQGSTFSGYTGALAVLNGQSTSGGWTDATWSSDPQVMKNNYELVGNDYINQMYSGNVDWVLKPTFFVNLTAGSLSYNTTQPTEFADLNNRYIFSSSNLTYNPAGAPTIPAEFRHASGWANTARTSSLTVREYYQRLFANVNTIWYKNMGGQHTFKFGMRYERVSNEMQNGEQWPRFNIFWNSSRTLPSGEKVRGTYGYYRARQIYTTGSANTSNWSLWGQDSWTISNKLTVNAGLRAEREHVPSYTADGSGIEFSFRDKLAPRVGFAYDVQGNSKWKMYGSFGYFYDMMKLSLPIGAFGGDKWKDYYFTLDTYDFSQIQCQNHDGWAGNCGPGKLIEVRDMRFNSSAVNPALTAYYGGTPRTTIDPDLKPYKTGELTFGLDHELNATTSVGVRYVHKWLFRAIEDVGVLIPSIGEVYFISNPGFGVSTVMLPEFPDKVTPKAQRDYDSVEFRVRKRLAKAWSINASYLWSRLYGNYSGLASSDEAGRTDPNVSRYYDAPYMSYNSQGQTIDGLLYTDRPHQVKIQATYDFKFGTSVGLNATYQSGVPVGTLITWEDYPVFLSTRNSLGRTPFQQRYDLYLQHDIRLKGNHRINLNLNVDNLFDLKTITDYNQTLNRDSLNADDSVFFAGFDAIKMMNEQRAAGEQMRYNPLVWDGSKINPKYFSLMGRRAIRVGFKYAF